MNTDNSLGYGVYYALDDYAGLLRRVAVIVIDSFVLVVLGIMLSILLLAINQAGLTLDPTGIVIATWVTCVWLYLTVLKRSSIRTVAYQILGLKIVTTKGERPSLFRMTVRMLLWIVGPFNLLLDLCWLGADSEQQSLRDCYVGTYVVRSKAKPLGVAPVHLTRYCGGGLAPMYPRVVRPKGPDAILAEKRSG